MSDLKRGICILLSVILVFSLFGCGGTAVPENDSEDPGAAASEKDQEMSKSSVVDRNGDLIGTIDRRAICTAVDGGIFYSIFDPIEGQFTAAAEYHFFSKINNNDILLGRLDDQGYEAVYTRTELEGKIYTLALQGYPMDEKPDMLLLLEFDTSAGSMKHYVISENGFPYAAMAVHNGKLLIMNHEMDDKNTDIVAVFDPSSGSINNVISQSDVKDSLRSICSAEEGIYVLRVALDSGTELFIDYYNDEYRKQSERSLNDIFLKTFPGMPGFEGCQDVLNELLMNVSRFSVLESKYLVYENFGRMRIAADLKTGEVLFAGDDLYAVSVGAGRPAIYHMDFDEDNIEDPEIYVISGDCLKKLDFRPSGREKMIRAVSHSASGTWLILTTDSSRITDGSSSLYLWTQD